MLIWNGTEYRQFLPVEVAPIPVASAHLTRSWILARNESLKDLRLLVERAKIRFASDPRFVGCSDFVVPDDLEMPLWVSSSSF